MKTVINHYILIIFAIGTLANFQMPVAQTTLSVQDKKIVSDFENRADEYVSLRERLENQLPKLSKEATPEEIETHKASFQVLVQAARQNARQGDIFTLPASQFIRKLIKNEFKGKRLVEIREIALGGETKGVPLRINYPYPETKEKVEMPPTLLLVLPQLPKQLRFRFVGRNLLLVDRENGLIVDYMTKAVP